MIHPDVDPAPWHAHLAQHGRVQVEAFLQPPAAQRLRDCLLHEVPWTLALRDADGPRTLDHATYSAMSAADVDTALQRARSVDPALAQSTDDAFRFAYDSYMMVRAYQEGRDPGLLLHRVLELFNSPPYLALMHALTGDTRIRRINAQATVYRAGHFLREHTDIDSGEGRLYAYVLNLSRDWHADWGGLLQFIDGDRVIETFTPRFNTLSLFTVPAPHAVTQVMPWAQDHRLAITGWLLA